MVANKIVAHCATPFLPETGSWIYNQMSKLKSYRPIALTQEARNLEQFPLADLFTAESLTGERGFANRLWRRVIGQYLFYADFLCTSGAVLIHAHHGFQGFRCLRAKRQTELPMITSFYGADATRFSRHKGWMSRFRKLFTEGERFLAEGSTMAEQLVKIGCPEKKIIIHHLGIDLDEISSAVNAGSKSEGEELRILICASFREKKGIPDGIEATARAVARTGAKVRLVLIGDGPGRLQVQEALSDNNGLRVDRLGYVSYSRFLHELDRGHILLQPSKTAANGDSEGGAPVVLLDAQAARVPVVSTRHADIPEYVIDGEGGLLAAEKDIDGLTERLCDLLLDPGMRARMGDAGRKHVEEHYNAELQVPVLESIYDDLT